MPGLTFHQCLTRQALKSNHVAHAENLIQSYCAYPDFYFEERTSEVKPYMYFHDGIQFHYPPHTPVEEFYRYWDRDVKGNFPFNHHENENIIHVESGFRFYLNKIIPLLKNGEQEEAWKFLGCLLHFLEDSTFGVHALEGADGTDLFVLDRLFGADIAKYLCSISLPERFHSITVEPHPLTSDSEESVPLLYARYVRDTAQSRQFLFDIAVKNQYGKSHRSFEKNLELMFTLSLQLAADAIATVLLIASGENSSISERKLNEFSPYHYPIGGSGFALRKYEEKDNTITFGVNSKASLLYRIPENLYKTFSCNIHGIGIKQIVLELFNKNEIIRRIEMEGEKEIFLEIPSPGGTMGFRISSPDICGQIRISDGIFHRK
jgi:hypothetical protein